MNETIDYYYERNVTIETNKSDFIADLVAPDRWMDGLATTTTTNYYSFNKRDNNNWRRRHHKRDNNNDGDKDTNWDNILFARMFFLCVCAEVVAGDEIKFNFIFAFLFHFLFFCVWCSGCRCLSQRANERLCT